jgi:teichuronic acid biosynthesis glycosyltransferase TuaC
MKVLFISSGNKKRGISPIVFNQGEQLKMQGIELEYFTIFGKGWLGYGKHLLALAIKIHSGNYDILHAHYSLSGFLVSLASPFKSNIVVSLMGTINKGTFKYRLIHLLNKYKWKNIIVKSERMKAQSGINTAVVIPNGVELAKFTTIQEKDTFRKKLKLPLDEKVVLFLADPNREEKNFELASKISENTSVDHILLTVYDQSHNTVVDFLNAADALLLTSFTEGSPNVIKEAMAVGCPIVSTNVGDVDYLLKNVTGSYMMTSYNIAEGVELLTKALNFKGKTNGRDRLKLLNIDSVSISERIVAIYKK